ncbi:MAG: hypothetical protein Udaeo2_20250 [Candidatus Udaeobacter sp.]|nr:MAG: hypothetical protein Udaeo2_20250 [Candidatus Udaeobacter sp.]
MPKNGHTRASAFLDQMRNVQSSASRGGEFADGAVPETGIAHVRFHNLRRQSDGKQVALSC